jgi:Flp pilus assembly pilin Flp
MTSPSIAIKGTLRHASEVEGGSLHMRSLTFAFLAKEAQTMAEYAVTLGVITLGIVTALGTLALGIEGRLGTVIGFF